MQFDIVQKQLRRIERLGKHSYRRLKSQFQTQSARERAFRTHFFADEPVDLVRIQEFRNEYFPQSGPIPWLDRPDALIQIENKLRAGEISQPVAEKCRDWVREGYLILEGALDPAWLDKTWASYEQAIAEKKVIPEPADEFSYPGRLLNPHLEVSELKELLHHPLYVEWIRVLFGKEPLPYQTITSHRGSEQKEHSDSIHMTTYPLGYLAAIWTAFEDIHPDSGPLVYYPGSHRLDYYFSHHVGIAPGEFRKQGYSAYSKKYEPFIQKVVEKHGLKPKYFTPKKGDALIWHANLIHGGSFRKARPHSRRSVVCHYFAKGAVCYHDLAGGKELESSGLYNA